MKYIDAEKLIAEIERWKDGIGIGLCEYDAGEENGKMEILIKLSSLITSLQQEQPAGVQGTVHHYGGMVHYVDTIPEQLNARLKQFPEGTKVEVFVFERKEE